MLDRLARLVEPVAFLLIALFCFGAWATQPHRMFSLRESAASPDAESSILLSTLRKRQVELPERWREHFRSETCLTWSLTPSEPMSFDLNDMLKESGLVPGDSTGLFFYVLALNQTHVEYQIVALNASGRVQAFKTSSLIPPGGAIWRDDIPELPVRDGAVVRLSLTPSARESNIADVVFFDAPGLRLWTSTP
ncbi:MAG: hypothetical protein GC154_12275 [bacterium]|nr:hypothetical protein [bacterium]